MKNEARLTPEVHKSEASRLAWTPSRSAPVCKHASKARDPVDAFRSDVQSESGGVCGGRGLVVLL